MSTYLPEEVRLGLENARIDGLRRSSRLRLDTGDGLVRVLRLWDTGFSVAVEDAPSLRGLVDLYDGTKHIGQCLIVASEEDGREMLYEFKRNTAATDEAPADFYRDPQAPVALLGD